MKIHLFSSIFFRRPIFVGQPMKICVFDGFWANFVGFGPMKLSCFLVVAENQVCLYMHAPRDTHWNLIKRILRYLCGTINNGIRISASSSYAIITYSDANWAGCPDTRRSKLGYCVFLGDAIVSWSSKRLTIVSRSSAKAEYRAVANVAAGCCWLQNLLWELHVPVDKATLIYYDNISAVYLSENPVQHRCTKHVELDIHFLCEKVQLGQVPVLQVPSRQQFADIMTKGLASPLFQDFKSSLCIRENDAQTEGGVDDLV
jgi:hypothetical protein